MRFLFSTVLLIFLISTAHGRPQSDPCPECRERLNPLDAGAAMTRLVQDAATLRSAGDIPGYIRNLLCLSVWHIRMGDPITGLDTLNKAYQVTLGYDDKHWMPMIELAYARYFLLSNDLTQARIHFERSAVQCFAAHDSAAYAYVLMLAGETAFTYADTVLAIKCFSISMEFSEGGSSTAFRSMAGLLRCQVANRDLTDASATFSVLKGFQMDGADTLQYWMAISEYESAMQNPKPALALLDSISVRSRYFPELRYEISLNRRNVLAACGFIVEAIEEGEKYEAYMDSLSGAGYTFRIQKKLEEAETYYISQRLAHDSTVLNRTSSGVKALFSYVILLSVLVAATLITMGFLVYTWYRKREEAIELRNTGLSQMAELHRANRHLKEFSRLSGQALRGYLNELKHELSQVRKEQIRSDHNRMVFGLVETALIKLERLLGELDDILRFPDPRSLAAEKIRLDIQIVRISQELLPELGIEGISEQKCLPVTALGPSQYIHSILQNICLFVRDFYKENKGSGIQIETAHEGDSAILNFIFSSEKPMEQPETLFRFRSRVYDTTDPYTIYVYVAYMLTRSIGGDLRVSSRNGRNTLSLLLPSETLTQDEVHSLEEAK